MKKKILLSCAFAVSLVSAAPQTPVDHLENILGSASALLHDLDKATQVVVKGRELITGKKDLKKTQALQVNVRKMHKVVSQLSLSTRRLKNPHNQSLGNLLDVIVKFEELLIYFKEYYKLYS